LEESLKRSLDNPMQCFRCFDMKVVDPIVLESIRGLLREVYVLISMLDENYDELLERINRHIILLEAMPDE
jgi:hypothetical protein